MIRIMPFIDEELPSKCCWCCKKSSRSFDSSCVKLLWVWLYGARLVDGSIHETLPVRFKIKRLCFVIFKKSVVKFFVWCDRANSSFYMYDTTFGKKCCFIGGRCSECITMHIGYRYFFVFSHELCENSPKLINDFRIFFMKYSAYIKVDINRHAKFL